MFDATTYSRMLQRWRRVSSKVSMPQKTLMFWMDHAIDRLLSLQCRVPHSRWKGVCLAISARKSFRRSYMRFQPRAKLRCAVPAPAQLCSMVGNASRKKLGRLIVYAEFTPKVAVYPMRRRIAQMTPTALWLLAECRGTCCCDAKGKNQIHVSASARMNMYCSGSLAGNERLGFAATRRRSAANSAFLRLSAARLLP